MEEMIKNSIKARKDAFFNMYEIEEQSIIYKIDDLFNRISEFGENFSDYTDFETNFASSTLNQEYINLFTEIAGKCKLKNIEHEEITDVKTDEEYIEDELESELRYQAKEATMPIRRKLRQEAYDTARDMPSVGDVLYAKQNIDLINKFKKKKDK